MTSLDSENIMSGLKEGDDKALALVFKLFHKALCYFARQLVNDVQKAENIVADAFIKLWQKRGDFDTIGQARDFLYIATRHECYDYLKHSRRKIISHREIFHLAEKRENYIESKLVKAELLQIILLEVETLSPMRRKIFKMIYIDDLSIFEIAMR